MSFLNSLKWSFLGELASKLVQPIVFLVLTQLLTPEDFGVMAAALMTASFSQIFWEAGLGKALIQRRSNVEEAANVAFWTNLTLGFVFATLLFSLSDLIGNEVFRNTDVGPVLQLMALHPLLGALASVQLARLRKEMAFRTLFWVRLTTVFVPGLASIPLAVWGFGYWALVWGLISSSAATVAMLTVVHRWRPSWVMSRDVTREMFQFGSWVSLSGLLTWFYMWADSLVLGRYLGAIDLGIFRTGNQVAEIPFLFIAAPLMPVVYSQLSLLASNLEVFRRISISLLRSLILVAIPTGLILSSLAENLEAYLFGANWAGVGQVIVAMALLHGFSYIVSVNGEVYRAAGRPHLETIVTASSLVFYLPIILWVVKYGLETFIWVRLGLATIVMVVHLAVLDRLVKVGLSFIFADIFRISVTTLAIIFLFHFLGFDQLPSNIGGLIILGIAKVAVVSGSIYALERRKMVQELWAIIRLR